MSASWIELDRRHVWHPYTQMLTAPQPVAIERAEGVYLHTCDGRKLLDGISSWWVNIHGHAHPRLTRALSEQAQRLSQILFAGYTHENAARLASELSAKTGGHLSRVFYSDNGSTAVEVGMKMAYQYWHNRGDKQRTRFLALEHAYHGDTFGAMAASAPSVFHRAFTDVLFDVIRAPSPTCLHCPLNLSRDSCGIACAERFVDILKRERERICAVIIEPMLQGAGGMIVWPPQYLQQVAAACKEFGIPLVADEVFTGFGRTGKFFACEHADVVPDILCLSKAITGGMMPFGATLASEAIFEAFLSADRTKTLFHGHSYTGNALACALARESLRLFDEEDRLGRVAALQTRFGEHCKTLGALPNVAQTRVIGAMAAIELRARDGDSYLDNRGLEIAAELSRRGLLLRPLGRVVYFLPPYVITDAEVDFAFERIHEVLRLVGG